ncbi:ribosomal protein uL16 3-hydroxylase [Salinivibrio sp. IB282]|uniref:ribosomal protein uL16 3-hydroxylase n=1 Tax=Salinivibrio sp. IB282 TaxID=1766122 RepID=UPI0009885028|nr:cupin domain-containing protein [Salinivibrio sp. IB282]OOE70568.1 50S ribosomal protein L16 arginine hydroxylase [Salinivibrio sp. IB282]
MYQFQFSLAEFMATHWHQSPTVIRQGLADFDDPIEPEEVAGLAMEADIDSRLVTQADGKWQVANGPFEHFDDFPDTHAQLVVQAANHWHPGVRELADAFTSLPQWLFDDVMVCYSQPQGGVGPHIDQYDVFIVQGQGRRRWRVGPKGDYQEANLDTGLKQITGFDAIIDVVLEPGDILYIPPGFPHEGDTLEPSLSYSIGYRSPKARELLSSYADQVIVDEAGDNHFHWPAMSAQPDAPAALDPQHLAQMDEMMMALMHDETRKKRWIGEFLSQARHELDLLSPDPQWQPDSLKAAMQDGLCLEKLSGLRAFYHADQPEMIFMLGESFDLPEGCESLTPRLCNQRFIDWETLGKAADNSLFWPMLTLWVNRGYWYPLEEAPE